jgi:hypothetical protein
MRLVHASSKFLVATTVAVALAATFALVVFPPSPNVVSAEVYSNEVGFVKAATVDNGATLVSVPLTLLGDSPHYGLNNATLDGPGEIGQMLEADLVGGTTFSSADYIMYYDGSSYRTAWLYYNESNPSDPNNHLWFEGLTVSDLTLEPHQGFWIVRNNSSDPDTVTFLGEVRTDDPVPVVLSTGWNMFSWPYPTSHDLQTSTLYTDGAYAAATFDAADRIGSYSAVTGYQWHWLYTDGTWYTGLTPSTLTLEPDKGYWYYRQSAAGGALTWNCAKPY